MSVDRTILFNLSKLKEISVLKLANETGINQANLSRWFKGDKSGYVSAEKLGKVAKYLGLDYRTGKLFPKVHRWSFLPEDSITALYTLNSLAPQGGEILFFSVALDPPRPEYTGDLEEEVICRSFAYDHFSVALPNDDSFRVLLNVNEDFYYLIESELEKIKSPWKISNEKMKLFEFSENNIFDRLENESLSIPEFDQILGIKEAEWTWERLVSVMKAKGKVPSEWARELGFSNAKESKDNPAK